ncbi:MAG: substrate-binding domain-containing protein [Methylobacterium sp.]
MDGFRSSLSESIEKSAKAAGFTTLHASAKNDVATQLADVKQMIAAGASALVVVGVDTRAEEDVAKVVASAGLPLVFVNHEPPSTLLNARTVYVGSDEKESGTLQTREICRRLGGKGGITVLMGELTHPAARMRTHDVHDVLKTPECQGLEILEEQSANWSREQAADITRVWLDGKLKPQAIIANNDAMALGAIDSIKATGATGILVAGIDATDGALQSLASGDLALTILQDAQGQGRVAIELTQKLLRNEPVEAVTYVPFQLVTPADVQTLLAHRAKN